MNTKHEKELFLINKLSCKIIDILNNFAIDDDLEKDKPEIHINALAHVIQLVLMKISPSREEYLEMALDISAHFKDHLLNYLPKPVCDKTEH